jgi:epoxide hydrolase-like predicted phosphatase
MSIHAIIWDLGGVLVRTEDFKPRDQLAARLGLRREELNDLVFGSEDDHRAQLGEISHEEQWENVASRLGVQAEEVPAIREVFFAGDALDSELIDFIRELKHDYYTALLSNAFSDLREMVCDVWQIDDVFHHLIISAEVGLMKPDPAIYQLALETIGVEPEEAVFIDDFPQNVVGAIDSGLHAIQFRGAGPVRSELKKLLDNPAY